jgi:hypothetical protein
VSPEYKILRWFIKFGASLNTQNKISENINIQKKTKFNCNGLTKISVDSW